MTSDRRARASTAARLAIPATIPATAASTVRGKSNAASPDEMVANSGDLIRLS